MPSSRRLERSCCSGILLAPAHEGADRRRRGVEDRHAVLLDDRPEAVLVGVVGRALVHHAGRAVGQRPVDDVAVAGDPADVGRAPVDVVVLQVEDVLRGASSCRPGSRPWCAACPSACRWCPRCTGCRADARSRAASGSTIAVPRLVHERGATRRRGRCVIGTVAGVVGAVDDQHVLDGRALLDGLVERSP